MESLNELDRIPEDIIVISGETLLSRRHMPTPPNLQTAIRKPRDPRHLYEILREEYSPDHPLRLLDETGSRDLILSDLVNNTDILDHAAYLVIHPLSESCAFETFQNTVAILRGPNGCPWDKKQTHQSLRDDLLQEVYELLDGLDRKNTDMIVEELGDVLLHILLQTQIGIDNGEFTTSDVIRHINDKIIYRHEHVFGKPEDISPDTIMQRWEQIKQKERVKQHRQGGMLDGISNAMPALSMAYSYQKRASKAGFDWQDADAPWEKLAEELEEFQNAPTAPEQEKEFGDILFCIVNIARLYKIDPESALRMANLKFKDRIHYVEKKAQDQGKTLFELPAEEKEEAWNEAKNLRRNIE